MQAEWTEREGHPHAMRGNTKKIGGSGSRVLAFGKASHGLSVSRSLKLSLPGTPLHGVCGAPAASALPKTSTTLACVGAPYLIRRN